MGNSNDFSFSCIFTVILISREMPYDVQNAGYGVQKKKEKLWGYMVYM